MHAWPHGTHTTWMGAHMHTKHSIATAVPSLPPDFTHFRPTFTTLQPQISLPGHFCTCIASEYS
jgi:hypothetical protein